MENLKLFLRLALSLVMLTAGILHFLFPQTYMAAMPSYLPWHYELVLVSGFFEIIGAAGLLIKSVRLYAGFGLILLFLAVFPANLHMALNPNLFSIDPVYLWLRLPFQLVFILWAWWVADIQVFVRAKLDRDDNQHR